LKLGIAPQFVSSHNRRSPMDSVVHVALAAINNAGAGVVGVFELFTAHPAFTLRAFGE
jgi:hypothetical protein